MNKPNVLLILIQVIFTAILFVLGGCGPIYPSNSPSYNGGGGYDPYYERDRYERKHDWERERREEHEREELAREHQRHEDERRHWDNDRVKPAPPPPPAKLNCPAGTHPSTHRCTNEERKRGCKDYGGTNGQGCSNF
jgi:hypothetical protein